MGSMRPACLDQRLDRVTRKLILGVQGLLIVFGVLSRLAANLGRLGLPVSFTRAAIHITGVRLLVEGLVNVCTALVSPVVVLNLLAVDFIAHGT